MRLTSFDDELAKFSHSAARQGAAGLAAAVALAWHRRQREPRTVEAALPALRDAVAALPPPEAQPMLARLMLVEGELDLQFARLDAARAKGVAAREAFEALGDMAGASDAMALQAMADNDNGNPAEASAGMEAAAVRAQVAGDPERAEVWQAFADLFWTGGHAPQTQARWRAVLDGADSTVDASLAADQLLVRAITFEVLGLASLRLGENRKSVAVLEMALPLYRRLGQERRVAIVSCNLGSALSNLADHEGALEYLGEAIERARPHGVARNVGILLMQSAHTQFELGNLPAAREQALEAQELLTSLKRTMAYGTLLQVLGEVTAAQGDLEAALGYYREQEAHALQIGSAIHQAGALRQQASVLADMGQAERAIVAGESALRLARMHSNPIVESEALRALGVAHGGRNEPAPSGSTHPSAELHWLFEAVDTFRRSGNAVVSHLLLSRVSAAYARLGRFEEAYAYACQAAASREQEQTRRMTERASALEVRYRTARAREQAEYLARLAEEQTQRARALERNSDTLATLSVLGRELTTHLDEQRIFDTLARHVGGLLDAAGFAVFLLSADGTQLELAMGVEQGRAIAAPPIRLDDPVANTALCARTQEDVYRTFHSPTEAAEQNAQGTLCNLSALYTPLLLGERLLGVMTLQSARSDAYGNHERLVLRMLGAYGAIALENSWAYRRLKEANAHLAEIGLTDPLTGLHNRRFLDQQLAADVALTLRAYEQAQPALPDGADLVFFLVDIDHFKQINDEHGHASGDEVLVQLRDRLRTVCRDGDYLVRWGGEEILLVARQSSWQLAPAMGERLRAAIGTKPFPVRDMALRVTASIGIAPFPLDPSQPRAATWQQALEQADVALYQAKAQGRNRVCLAPAR
jgi:diguanylate cyclase (GGDEF)-like protein